MLEKEHSVVLPINNCIGSCAFDVSCKHPGCFDLFITHAHGLPVLDYVMKVQVSERQIVHFQLQSVSSFSHFFLIL